MRRYPDQHWSRQGLVAWTATSHCLNQWRNVVNSLGPNYMCLTITPSMVQLVTWSLSDARPKSEPEVCSFCWFIPSEFCTFQCIYFTRFFVDGYFIGISLKWIEARTFCFADAMTVNIAQMVEISCIFCLCILLPCWSIVVLKIKYSWILNPEFVNYSPGSETMVNEGNSECGTFSTWTIFFVKLPDSGFKPVFIVWGFK